MADIFALYHVAQTTERNTLRNVRRTHSFDCHNQAIARLTHSPECHAMTFDRQIHTDEHGIQLGDYKAHGEF